MENLTKHELLTSQEGANLLRVSPVTLWRLRKEAKIPFLRIGKQVRYRKEDLENYLVSVTHTSDTDTFVCTARKG